MHKSLLEHFNIAIAQQWYVVFIDLVCKMKESARRKLLVLMHAANAITSKQYRRVCYISTAILHKNIRVF